MADIAVTAASVLQASGYNWVAGIAGATITQGQSVYQDTTTNTWKLAKANAASTAGTVGNLGIALVSCVASQPIIVQTGGSINPGATVVKGTTYVVSPANAGGIAPIADLASGNVVSILGTATSASNIAMALSATGVAI